MPTPGRGEEVGTGQTSGRGSSVERAASGGATSGPRAGASGGTLLAPFLPRDLVGARLGVGLAVGVALSLGVYFVSRANYLLFHSLAEIASAIVGVLLFVTAWRLFPLTKNSFLTFLGVGYVWVAIIDLLHMLAYKGMGVFPEYDADLPTQLWIVARLLQAGVLFVAPAYLRRELRPSRALFGVGAVATLGVALVFLGWFPACFVEGEGLTSFKVAAEYAISAILVGALVHLRSRSAALDRESFLALTVIILVTILSELAFTLYRDVYGISNFVGHIFKLIAFAGLYALVVRNMLARPVGVLAGLVPICAGCKAIRDEEGRWRRLESFLGEATGAQFSHGLCPECFEKYDD